MPAVAMEVCKHGLDPTDCAPCLKSALSRPPIKKIKAPKPKKRPAPPAEQPAAPEEPSLSNLRKLLHAAAELKAPFTKSDLVVRVWQKYPVSFGLAGHQDCYPDAHKVSTYLYGSHGLVLRGLLQPVDAGMYLVTGKGVALIG